VQLDAQTAKRDTEKISSTRTISVAADERIENVSLLNVGKYEATPRWFHGSSRLIELKRNMTRSNGYQIFTEKYSVFAFVSSGSSTAIAHNNSAHANDSRYRSYRFSSD
jgi:hypothetical protein